MTLKIDPVIPGTDNPNPMDRQMCDLFVKKMQVLLGNLIKADPGKEYDDNLRQGLSEIDSLLLNECVEKFGGFEGFQEKMTEYLESEDFNTDSAVYFGKQMGYLIETGMVRWFVDRVILGLLNRFTVKE